jgi:putative addiction module component (TIGR02574 family)
MELAVEEAWRAEVRRRVEELRSGAVPSIPGEQVFREIDEMLT